MRDQLAAAAPRRIVRDYLAFVLLLAGRFVADWQRFPVDGYVEVKLPHVVEFLVFYALVHASVCLLFYCLGVAATLASRYSLLTLGVCLYLHFLEYFFHAGGRASSYAPADHFLTNLLTGFLATGDAGFWQIMRLVACGPLVLALLIRHRGPRPSIFVGSALFYVWGMLLVHQEVWLLLPEESSQVPVEVLRDGVFSYAATAWMVLFLGVISWLLTRRAKTSEPKQVAAWTVCFLAWMFLVPAVFEDASVTRWFALCLCLITLRVFTQVLRVSAGDRVLGALPAAFGALLAVVMVADLSAGATLMIPAMLTAGWIGRRLGLGPVATGALGGSVTALVGYAVLAGGLE